MSVAAALAVEREERRQGVQVVTIVCLLAAACIV